MSSWDVEIVVFTLLCHEPSWILASNIIKSPIIRAQKRRNSIIYFCVQCEFYQRRTFFFSNVTFSFFPMIRYLIDILRHCFFNYCQAICLYNLLRYAACVCIDYHFVTGVRKEIKGHYFLFLIFLPYWGCKTLFLFLNIFLGRTYTYADAINTWWWMRLFDEWFTLNIPNTISV